jgi:Right handed beta helix region
MTIRLAASGALLLAMLAPATVLAAPAQRTFVASNGSDVDPCSLSQPCRSFAAAIAKTSDAGEVTVLDSAGYGPVTIAQSVSIIAPEGIYAGVTVTSGNGITVNGAGIVVALRGFSINGQGGVTNAVDFQQGAFLSIEGCEITKHVSGVMLEAPNSRVSVQNAHIRNNSFAGIYMLGTAGGMQVSIANSEIANNFAGVQASALGLVQATVAHSTLTNNERALVVLANPGGNASIFADGNTITYSETVFYFAGAGIRAIFTAGNNAAGYYTTLIQGGVLTPCCNA